MSHSISMTPPSEKSKPYWVMSCVAMSPKAVPDASENTPMVSSAVGMGGVVPQKWPM